MGLQSLGSPAGRDFGTPGSPGKKSHLDVVPETWHREYYKGVRWWLTPKPGVWCVKVSPSSPVAVPTLKGPRMSSKHFVWFHAGPCE
jgi:hypothetical protein